MVTTVLNTINSGLTKKTDYNTKISEINKKIFDHNHHKYITTGKFNKLMADNFAARLKQASLATKTDIDDFVEKTGFDGKLKNSNKNVISNKTKHIDIEKKLTDLTKKVAQISEKWYDILLGRMTFTGNDDYQHFFSFSPQCLVHQLWIIIKKLLTGYRPE